MQYNELRISYVANLLFSGWIHGKATFIKQATTAQGLYHMTATDGHCQMSLESNSVSFRQPTVLRSTARKELKKLGFKH